jgi:hypothetical protein
MMQKPAISLDPSAEVTRPSGRVFEIVFGSTLMLVGLAFLGVIVVMVYMLSDIHTKSVALLYLVFAIFLACAYLSLRAAWKLLRGNNATNPRVFATSDMYIAGMLFATSFLMMIGESLIWDMRLNGLEIYSVISLPIFAYWCFKFAKRGKEKAKP